MDDSYKIALLRKTDETFHDNMRLGQTMSKEMATGKALLNARKKRVYKLVKTQFQLLLKHTRI